MRIECKVLTEDEVDVIFNIEENHFNDFKAKEIGGKGFGKIVSAFANASGGDIYIGIREENDTKEKHWEGFNNVEEANSLLQVLDEIQHIDNYYTVEFLQHPFLLTYVLKVAVFKTQSIIERMDGKIYVRKGAQSLPVDTIEKKRRLELDKGVSSYEDDTVADSIIEDVVDTDAMSLFVKNVLPGRDFESWLKKQRLFKNGHVTVAGELLFSDEPQIVLPKRSSIKILRYRTTGEGERDTLSEDPITVEGCAYSQIYCAVSKVKEVIESMKKLGEGLESVEYPEETLHEIITNAVLHRDYSIVTDIQIRIYDNRVEVESPGKLPGHVTVENILDSQSARNPKMVRLINKFPEAPNKDVGEGLNTAFEAMSKLRLKAPEIKETDVSVVVIIKHERLASPEEQVLDYLKSHSEISNANARILTGIKSENTMKRVFYKLRDHNLLEMVPCRAQNKAAWRLVNAEAESTVEEQTTVAL